MGFPLARLVGVISLASGALLGAALGPYQGKGTGEHALFRELHDDVVQAVAPGLDERKSV